MTHQMISADDICANVTRHVLSVFLLTISIMNPH